MRKFLREAWAVLVERQKTHKALRLLSKQEWSVEFLTAMLVRASRVTKQQLEMSITNGGNSITVRTIENQTSKFKDDSIFDHLDDQAKVNQWVESMSDSKGFL
jgi:hypothetical protein